MFVCHDMIVMYDEVGLLRIVEHHYRTDKEMARNGSWAISALCSQSAENKQRFCVAGADDLLSRVIFRRVSQSDPVLYSNIAKAAQDQLKL
jgi:hypothetical protein